jgi:hypothetical protein
MIANNWDYMFVSSKLDWNIITYYIVKNTQIIKNKHILRTIKDPIGLNSKPSIYLSKDGKHYWYTYRTNDKYCLNIDWDLITNSYKCFKSEDWYTWYPSNLSFSNDWKKFMYSIRRWEAWDELGSYYDYISIKHYIKYKTLSYWIKDLFFSPDLDKYISTSINYNSKIPKLFIFENWDLVNDKLWYTQYDIWYDNENKLYYNGFTVSDNEFQFYINKEKVPYYIMNKSSDSSISFESSKGVDIENRIVWYGKLESYFIYNEKEYKNDYGVVWNLSILNWKMNFLWINTNNWKVYNVSCSFNENISDNDEKVDISYELSENEIKLVNTLWNKINNMSQVKINKYNTLLNKYLDKFEEWSKKYEIVKQLLTVINSDLDFKY